MKGKSALRTYAFNEDLSCVPSKDFDVVIIGAGIAGIYSALNLDAGLRCAIINKRGSNDSNSIFAQGGIASVISMEDSVEKHIEDTLVAGAGLCDIKAVEILVEEGPEDISHLMKLGVAFDTDESGKLSITREGAHSCNRILHCHGDATGFHVTKVLQNCLAKRKNLHPMEGFALADILTDCNHSVCGVILQDSDGKYLRINTANVILATGGIGRVYRNSTNAISLTGDGIAAAIRAGAQVANMEFVQFHPTALIHPGLSGRYFLISEALRGEGAILRNRKWEAFMKDVHPLADLAPRDIVSRAIISEMKKHNLPNVYLDITQKSREFLQKRFPTIYGECMKYDIDIAINWIPVIPVQHYFMGGIKTDTDGRTTVSGLYACGENASTGVHGANRLASNSLLECLVFGRRAARDINIRTAKQPDFCPISKRENELDISTVRFNIRDTMTKQCGIIRNGGDMQKALAVMQDYYDKLSGVVLTNVTETETLNMSTVAIAVINAAIARKKSIGAHFRSDDN